MPNLHPPLTGLPFSLLVVLAVVELFRIGLGRSGLDRTAQVLMLALVISTPLTFFSGYFAAAQADAAFKVEPEYIENHRAMGRLFVISLVPLILTMVLRSSLISKRSTAPKFLTAGYLIFLALSLLLVIWTGLYGGELVFIHGAGVSAGPGQQQSGQPAAPAP